MGRHLKGVQMGAFDERKELSLGKEDWLLLSEGQGGPEIWTQTPEIPESENASTSLFMK